MTTKADWIWMPHPGHFICARDCRFHLNTFVPNPHGAIYPGYLISTVGEYLPGEGVREIIAGSRGVRLKGQGDAREADFMRKFGWQEVGCGRLYETMVFHAIDSPGGPEQECCLYRMADGAELDFRGYNNPCDAYEGHLELCQKWFDPAVSSEDPT